MCMYEQYVAHWIERCLTNDYCAIFESSFCLLTSNKTRTKLNLLSTCFNNCTNCSHNDKRWMWSRRKEWNSQPIYINIYLYIYIYISLYHHHHHQIRYSLLFIWIIHWTCLGLSHFTVKYSISGHCLVFSFYQSLSLSLILNEQFCEESIKLIILPNIINRLRRILIMSELVVRTMASAYKHTADCDYELYHWAVNSMVRLVSGPIVVRTWTNSVTSRRKQRNACFPCCPDHFPLVHSLRAIASKQAYALTVAFSIFG